MIGLNVYEVTDCDGVYVFVAAPNRYHAMLHYPSDYPEHCYLIERDSEFTIAGDVTFEYERSRGVDLILNGVIEPNWFNDLHDPDFDDYRDWNGFVHARNE